MRIIRSLLWAWIAITTLATLGLLSFMAGGLLGAFVTYSDKLPEIPELSNYRPKTVSTFYSDEGKIIGIFYKEKRFVVDLDRVPSHVSGAFIAAEDSRFFEHGGVDWMGIARAAYKNAVAQGFQQGASTITQQVARHILLSKDKKISRKIKEMILARKIEELWGKEKILHVYLNEIYLGEHCYGVEAAARTYFDKHMEDLTIAEAAMLAGIVPSPSTYNPFKNRNKAMIKQRQVLKSMLRSGTINEPEYQRALKEELTFRSTADRPFDIVPDFTEAVRQYVIQKYGSLRLYHEGLKVFTTCRLDDQQQAIESLQKGLDEIKNREKRHVVLREMEEKDMAGFLAARTSSKLTINSVYQGLVTRVEKSGKQTRLRVSLDGHVHGYVYLPKPTSPYKVGQLLSLKLDKYENSVPVFSEAEAPPLQGALVCIENDTGFVRALVGGSSTVSFQFNRATQARRQPGSIFKPIIYSMALEKFGYTPATIIVDEPVVIELEGHNEEWSPKNADGAFLGPISLRRALEESRNICTIKILMDIGFDPVIQLARRMGIRSPLEKNLSLCLGTSEMSLYEMTTAYTVFPNGGVYLEPVLVKKIEDRYGNVLEDNTRIMRLDKGLYPVPSTREEKGLVAVVPFTLKSRGAEKRPDVECVNLVDPSRPWNTPEKREGESASVGPSPSPRPQPNSTACAPAPPRVERPALSPQTAYIMTSLLQGVVRAGTASKLTGYLRRRDLCGKTGTTDASGDAWFIGYNRSYTTGVWVGFDDNRPLGRRETGARAALPIWGYFMNQVLKGVQEEKFPVPEKLVRKPMPTVVFDKKTGPTQAEVVEPVYAPILSKALAVSPIDGVETVQAALANSKQLSQPNLADGTPQNAVYTPYRGFSNPTMHPASAPAGQVETSGRLSNPRNGYPNTQPRSKPLQPIPEPRSGHAR